MFDTQLVSVLMDADPIDVEEGLDELVELGLLEFIGQRRYRLHDLLRLFSSNELRQEQEPSQESQARLRRWLLHTARQAASLFEPNAAPIHLPEWIGDRSRADGWLRWNREQWWPAMQHASQLGEDVDVIETAEAFRWYAGVWMGWNSWQAVFTVSARSAQRIGDARVESMHLGYLAWADLTEQQEPQVALRHADEALLAAHRSGDQLALGWAHFYRGWALNATGDYQSALNALDQSAALFNDALDEGAASQAGSLAGGTLRALGRPAEAIAKLRLIIDTAVQADPETRATHGR